jgi:hypothetical protein
MNEELTPERVAAEIETLLGNVSGAHRNALQEAATFHTRMGVLMDYETRRLARKLGEDHPRVTQMKEHARYRRTLAEDLELQSELNEIKVPEVAERDVLLSGRVIDRNGRGIWGVVVHVVYLADRDNQPVSTRVRSEETGKSGYYSLVIDPETAGSLSKKLGDNLFLAVYTSRDRFIYRRPEPLTLDPGSRQSVDIVLDRGEVLRRPSGPGEAPRDGPTPAGEPRPATEPTRDSTEDVEPTRRPKPDEATSTPDPLEELREAGLTTFESICQADDELLGRLLGGLDVAEVKTHADALRRKRE